MAVEVMLPTPAIRNMIREEKVHQMYAMVQAGGKLGMQTMNQSLAELVRSGKVAREEAFNRSSAPEELATLLGPAGAMVPGGAVPVTGLVNARR